MRYYEGVLDVWVNVCHNFTDLQLIHAFLTAVSNSLTVRRTAPNTLPSVATKDKIERMIKCWRKTRIDKGINLI
jgi:hypothetical protein